MKKLVIVASVALFIGFLVGQRMTSNDSLSTGAKSSENDHPHVQSKTNAQSNQKNARVKSNLPTAESLPGSLASIDVKKMLGDRASVSFASNAEAYALIDKMNEVDLEEALHELLNKPNDRALKLFIGKYAELNIAGAMSFYENQLKGTNTRRLALNTIMASWTETDPSSAFDWYKKQHESGEMEGTNYQDHKVLSLIFRGLGENDLGSAISKLIELELDGNRGSMAVAGLTGALSDNKDFEYFFKNMNVVNNDQMNRATLAMWVRKSPEAAAEWSLQTENEAERKKLTERVMQNWVNSDLEAASEWYVENSGKNKERALHEVIWYSAIQVPKGVGEWMEAQGLTENINLIENYMGMVNQQYPDMAAKWVDRIDDTKKQKEWTQKIYNSWKQQDPISAENFLEKSP